MHALKVWMRFATGAERERLAALADTKVSYLYFLSNPKAAYGRTATAELAGRLAAAAEQIRQEGGDEVKKRLPALLRTDLSPVCQSCEYARKCLGASAVASEFDYHEMPAPVS